MKQGLFKIVCAVLWLATACVRVSAAELVIPGSGDCEFVLNQLAAAFEQAHPGRRVTVPPSVGSTGGVQAVLKDGAILARSARPLKPDELQGGLKSLSFGRDGVVFAVGEKVNVKSLTPAPLADLFGGRVTNWRELGGAPGAVRLVVREESETSFVHLRASLGTFRTLRMSENAKMVAKTGEMIELITRYKTAIGWATHWAVLGGGSGVRALNLNGVAASAATVASGQYPVAADYFLVFKEERLTAEAREFLAFAGSAAARGILDKLGVGVAARQ